MTRELTLYPVCRACRTEEYTMDITSLKLVYFSPTGTTGRVVQGIAEGIGAGPVDRVDITTPPGRQTPRNNFV